MNILLIKLTRCHKFSIARKLTSVISAVACGSISSITAHKSQNSLADATSDAVMPSCNYGNLEMLGI